MAKVWEEREKGEANRCKMLEGRRKMESRIYGVTKYGRNMDEIKTV